MEGGSEIVLQMPENRPKDAPDPIVYLDHSISHSISQQKESNIHGRRFSSHWVNTWQLCGSVFCVQGHLIYILDPQFEAQLIKSMRWTDVVVCDAFDSLKDQKGA